MSATDGNYQVPSGIREIGDPAGMYRAVTPGASPLPDGPCRGILCSADGTLKLTDLTGTVTDNVPVQQGYNPLSASVINTATSGTAPTTVIALY